jgi:hypothetical protein
MVIVRGPAGGIWTNNGVIGLFAFSCASTKLRSQIDQKRRRQLEVKESISGK